MHRCMSTYNKQGTRGAAGVATVARSISQVGGTASTSALDARRIGLGAFGGAATACAAFDKRLLRPDAHDVFILRPQGSASVDSP